MKSILLIPIVLSLSITACAPSLATSPMSEPDLTIIDSIYWSDGDSGRLNGNIDFRLNSIDAPETGGVGAAIGGAKCEEERSKGYEAKAWVVEFTRDVALVVTASYGSDRYGRLIIDLDANKSDVGAAGQDTGYDQPWPHDGKKSLGPRPKWCKLD